MGLAESIYAKLSGTPALAALVADRIYPVVAAPQAALPYIVWQEIGGAPVVTLGEASTYSHRLVQFSCFATTYLAARNLGALVVAALDSVPLAGGELATQVTPRDGFSEELDAHIRIVEAYFWAGPN